MRHKKATWTGLVLLAATAAALALVPMATSAQCGVTCTNASDIPTGNYLRSVVYGTASLSRWETRARSSGARTASIGRS